LSPTISGCPSIAFSDFALAAAMAAADAGSLVAIGMHLDVDAVRASMRAALAPITEPAPAQGIRRLQRYRRLSV
jgi:hypothetical protein